MTIPNLPTDNLYKFLSLFGLVLIIFGNYIKIEQTGELNDKFDKIYLDVEMLNYDIELSNERNKNFIQEINLICFHSDCNCEVVKKDDYSISVKTDTINCNVKKSLIKKIFTIQNSIAEENEKVIRKKKEIEVINEIFNIKEKELDNIYVSTNILIIIGIICAVFGFSFWYKKAQIHYDNILKNEAEKLVDKIDSIKLVSDESKKSINDKNKTINEV